MADDPTGRHHVDWAAADRAEAQRRLLVARQRRLGRGSLVAGRRRALGVGL
jgi:hypothetical protein